jgi:micrococcal nuclease
MLALLSVLLGCRTLDDVPLQVGALCDVPREATVVRVLDGDTIQVDSCEGDTIRFLGVSAPEVIHDVADACTSGTPGPADEEQCFGPEARTALSELLTGKVVRLEFDTRCTDIHERMLAYVYLPGGEVNGEDLLVNEWLIRNGYAEVYEAFDDILLAEVLYTAEYAAKGSNAGLWAACE